MKVLRKSSIIYSTEQAENDTSIDPERAESLRNELRGIMSGYNSLTDEGKEFVKQW